MTANQYRGLTVRITRGTGAGQEQSIAANGHNCRYTNRAWIVAPDASSYFVVAESGWSFGALTQSSPVSFPNPQSGRRDRPLDRACRECLESEQDRHWRS